MLNVGQQPKATTPGSPYEEGLCTAHRSWRTAMPAWRLWLKLLVLSILAAYLFLVGHRPVIYIPGSIEDDALFSRLAIELASGRWLGKYDQLTFVKGIGYPVFLCLNYQVGLPINTAVCLSYAIASLYFSIVVRPFLGSLALMTMMLFALLFIPVLASYETGRVVRDFFYTALTLATFAAVINLVLTRVWPRSLIPAAILPGVLGGWLWVTREEGIWLVPSLALLALAGLWAAPKRSQIVRGVGITMIVAILLICSVGLVNRMVYGRFVLTEMNSAPFQSALGALEKASFPEWTPYVPVPLGARLKIYEQSPSFARLKPYLDPPDRDSVWVAPGCDLLKVCDDIAGGWFVWALRDAAADAGVMVSPKSAAMFFHKVESEISEACNDGRLTCAAWLPPLVPPFTSAQFRKFPRQLRAATAFALLQEATNPGWPPINSLSSQELQGLEMTSVPEHGPGRIITARGHAQLNDTDNIFSNTGSTQVLNIEWTDGSSAGASEAQDQAFSLTLACLFDPCTVKAGIRPGLTFVLPNTPSALTDIKIDDRGTLSFDSFEISPLTLRSRAEQWFNRSLPVLDVGYKLLVEVGALCFLANIVTAAIRRRPTASLTIATILGVAVAARIVLVAIVHATAFPAIGPGYLMPAMPLSVVIAILAVAETVTSLARRLRAAPKISAMLIYVPRGICG